MPRVDTSFRLLRNRHREDNVKALSKVFSDMRAEVNAKHAAGAKRVISAHWDKVLAAAVLDRNFDTAADVAVRVVKALKPKRAADDGEDDEDDEYAPEVMRSWLTINAQVAAEGINAHAEADIDATDDDDPVGHVFDILLASGVAEIAQRMVTTAAGFGARDAGEKAGAGSKIWQVNSGNPRSSHAAMDGEQVPMNETFSNGMNWPGDPDGGPDENAGCQCSLTMLG